MDLSLNKLNDEFIKRLICVGIDFAIFILIFGLFRFVENQRFSSPATDQFLLFLEKLNNFREE
jgi:hypothetical protein